jgi:hypothetical protein
MTADPDSAAASASASAPPPDRFEATFVLAVDRRTAWRRLTEHPLGDDRADQLWLPGFDSSATVVAADQPNQLQATKDDEPCAGTDILVTLEDADTGTRLTVVQSRFGDWLPARYDLMAVGWRHIVADLETYLFTGVHGRRHLRPWPDFGADVVPLAGGLQVAAVRSGTLAGELGLREHDLLLTLAGAPVSSYDDLVTVARVLDGSVTDVAAEFVRAGVLEMAAVGAP